LQQLPVPAYNTFQLAAAITISSKQQQQAAVGSGSKQQQ